MTDDDAFNPHLVERISDHPANVRVTHYSLIVSENVKMTIAQTTNNSNPVQMEPALDITGFEQVFSCICLSYKRFSFDRFQVLTAVTMESTSLFCDVTQYSVVKVHRRF